MNTPPKSPTCSWIVFVGRGAKKCQCAPTHYEPDGAGQFCNQHAEDYEDVFGECLKEFPMEEVKP